MHRWLGTSLAASLLLTACVTINVYFPAAEAKEAAKEFVAVSYTHLDVYKRQCFQCSHHEATADGIVFHQQQAWLHSCLLYTSRCV